MRVGLIPESVCLEARMSPFVAPRRTAERARSAIGTRPGPAGDAVESR